MGWEPARKELLAINASKGIKLIRSPYDCYTIIVDVCLLVELFLELGVLLDRPVRQH